MSNQEYVFPCDVASSDRMSSPNSHQVGSHLHAQYGMTLRDYFAAAYLAALGLPKAPDASDKGHAERAYKMADAMLTARQK